MHYVKHEHQTKGNIINNDSLILRRKMMQRQSRNYSLSVQLPMITTTLFNFSFQKSEKQSPSKHNRNRMYMQHRNGSLDMDSIINSAIVKHSNRKLNKIILVNALSHNTPIKNNLKLKNICLNNKQKLQKNQKLIKNINLYETSLAENNKDSPEFNPMHTFLNRQYSNIRNSHKDILKFRSKLVKSRQHRKQIFYSQLQKNDCSPWQFSNQNGQQFITV